MRPITAISTDSDDPIILSPTLLLTHKDDTQTPNQMDYKSDLDMRYIDRAQWETPTLFIRIVLVEVEKGLSLYSPISQEVAG